jgi:hypothetical protein
MGSINYVHDWVVPDKKQLWIQSFSRYNSSLHSSIMRRQFLPKIPMMDLLCFQIETASAT